MTLGELIRFNPRARVGRDVVRRRVRYIPTRFNPRARVGRDLLNDRRIAWLNEFQSTRPRGARRLGIGGLSHDGDVSIHAPAWGATVNRRWRGCRMIRFNPRARVGRDAIPRLPGHGTAAVSIHAPAWGATCTGGVLSPPGACFNPRARVGRDPARLRSVYSTGTFQSTRPRGARLACPGQDSCLIPFQSTRPRGARRAWSR